MYRCPRICHFHSIRFHIMSSAKSSIVDEVSILCRAKDMSCLLSGWRGCLLKFVFTIELKSCAIPAYSVLHFKQTISFLYFQVSKRYTGLRLEV